jgi:hypothetical protein
MLPLPITLPLPAAQFWLKNGQFCAAGIGYEQGAKLSTHRRRGRGERREACRGKKSLYFLCGLCVSVLTPLILIEKTTKNGQFCAAKTAEQLEKCHSREGGNPAWLTFAPLRH